MELLVGLHRSGSTIVMVTHDHRFNRYATRSIALLDGHVVATDSVPATL
jgi:putative ABC transport system ATP-binding protein